MYTRLLKPDQFRIHKYMVVKTEASQIGKTFIPLCEKVFKTQRGRIPIDPAILAAMTSQQIKKKTKNADARSPET